MRKLGIVAGGGLLPQSLAAHCRDSGRPYFVIRLRGFADEALTAHPSGEAGVAEIGRVVSLARKAGCEALCFAGQVSRPDFSTLKPDLRGLAALPAAALAARRGDDALLSFLMREFEKDGFIIEGAQDVMGDLAITTAPVGRHAPTLSHAEDIAKALAVAKTIGALDIGQGVVVCEGLVLAIEAQEGTDALLRRVAELPEALRGTPARRRGVLAKVAKPIQDHRVDLPTIGLATIAGADRAGLAGIVGVAGKLLVVDRSAVAEAADACGLFVLGVADEPA